MRETELKFAPPAAFALPDFGDGTGVALVQKLPVQNLRAQYFDTPDLRLARYGATLRYRTGEDEGAVWTLKLPLPGASPSSREELDFHSDAKQTPDEVLDLTTPFVRSDKLVPVTVLRTKRRRWMLQNGSNEAVAELVDDEVSVFEGRKVVGRFRELEVEQRNATNKQMKKIAASLRDAGAVDAEPIPKASRALALQRADKRPAAPESDGSARGVLTNALRNDLDRLIVHDPIARMGRDPEGVHQMRVATRRIRSNLKTFAELLDESWSTEVRSELKWMAELLGNVRDLDVQQARFREKTLGIDEVQPLFETLTRQHRRARSRLLDGMRSDRYRLLLETLVAAVDAPPVNEGADAEARRVMAPLVAGIWAELASEARSLTDQATDEQRHQVRIQAKRLRYAVEAILPCLGKQEGAARRFARRLAHVQDVLGEYQDARVAKKTLTSIATRGTKDPLFCISIGRVIERETQGGERPRAMFSEAWAKLDQKKNLGWLPT